MAQTYYIGVDDSSMLSVAVLSVNFGIIIAAFFLLGASWNNKPEFILPWLGLTPVKIIGIPVCAIYIITELARESNFNSIVVFLTLISLVIGIPLLGMIDNLNRFCDKERLILFFWIPGQRWRSIAGWLYIAITKN